MKNTIIIITMLLLLVSSAFALTTYDDPDTCADTGSWNPVFNGSFACDANWTSYADCDGDECEVIFNFTGLTSLGYYDTILLLTNFSESPQVSNGEDLKTDNPACVLIDNSISIRFFLNNSDGDNVSMSCYNGSGYEFMDDMSFDPNTVWDSELSLTDNQPSVWTDLSINGSTKDCDDARCFDVIFNVNDSTDVEFDCYLNIDGSEDASSRNSSIQNSSDSVLSACLTSGGSHDVYVVCEDEHGEGYGDTMVLFGEDCESCDLDSNSILILGSLLLLLLWFACSFSGGTLKFFKEYWYLVVMLFVLMLVVWWIQCFFSGGL